MENETMGARVLNSASGPLGRTTFFAQTRALFQKQRRLQLRQKCSLFTFIVLPVAFVMILYGIQAAVDSTLDSASNTCGCRCTRMCIEGECFTPTPDNFSGECVEFDKSDCALEYTTQEGVQSSLCDVEHPAKWPPLLFTPYLWNRARPEAPAVTVPYTGNDAGLAAAYMATFFPAMAGPATQGMAAAETLLSALRAGAEAGEAAAPYLGERMSGMIGAADALAGDPQLGVLSTTQSKQRAPATFVDSAWAGWEPLGAVAPDCSEIFSWVVDAAQESDLPGLISASEEDVKDGDENGLEMDRPFGEIGMGKLLTCVDARSRALTSIDDMKELLLCGHYEAAEECRMGANPQTNEFPFAIDWRDSGPGRLRLSLWYNATTSEVDTEDDQGAPRNLHRLVKPLNLAVQAWVREHVGADYEVRLSHTREMPNAARTLTLDIASLLGPAFYIFVLGLPLPTIVQALMYEKENRLRVMMKMHGLTDLSYWVVSYMWWGLTSTLYSIILLVVGVAAGLEFFKRNDPLVQIVFYITAMHAQIGQAFLMTALFKSTRTATTTSNLWILLGGLFCQNVLEIFIPRDKAWVPILEILPLFGMYRGLHELAQYAFLGMYQGGDGLTWERMSDDGNGMGRVMGIFVLEFFVFTLLAWYLEQVLDDTTGVRRHWLFFLDPWRNRQAGGALPGLDGSDAKASEEELLGDSEEVRAERQRVYGLDAADFSDHVVIAKDLRKVFPAQGQAPSKVAVKNLTAAVGRGEVLGLLGPNGAGKTTSISMLVGFLEPTSGGAVINGLSIAEDMDNIYSQMGVCPQHDILWDSLTGREHLEFYGRLKGISGAALKPAVDHALSTVNLLSAADKLSKEYSGGMKRRLSVAISIIGGPRVVYLDEPSTGLDPAARRQLWDAVKGAKEGKAVVLTTHSMQEAEVLCDRLGIFVNGELFTIGTPQEVIDRYGGYMTLSISTPAADQDAAKALVASISSAAQIVYEVAGTVRARLPGSVRLSTVYQRIEAAISRGLRVEDWALHHASLEDVFIQIATDAEKRAAQLHGESFTRR